MYKKEAVILNDIFFSKKDMHFLSQFGVLEAADMGEYYKETKKTPFIYDTYQLSSFLEVKRSQLFHITNNVDDHYCKIEIPKKNGGIRTVYAPDDTLKSIQNTINKRILSRFEISEYATAYRKKTCIADNALPHTNKKNILKLDITDFFGSISFPMIYNAVFNTSYYPKQIGTMLTTLCTRNECLTQGAPTSPCISNIIMKHFDDAMGKWCEKHGISYTRYCDDITFSGNWNLYTVYKKAECFLNDMGFELNERKTHFVSQRSRQTVTGIVVNEGLSLPREQRRKLRQKIYYALKFGLEDAIMHQQLKDFILHDGKADCERYYLHLLSKGAYALQINPDDKALANLLTQLKDKFSE